MEEATDNRSEEMARYQVDRAVLTTADLVHQYPGLTSTKTKAKVETRRSKRCWTAKKTREKFLPVLGWLSTYKWREWGVGDVVSGITVGVVNIPQSLAFSILAGLSPIFGLYTSFYPPLLYFLLGTSRHLSIGSFAVLSLLTQGAVLRLAPDHGADTSANNGSLVTSATSNVSTPSFDAGPLATLSEIEIKRIQVATALTFVSGAIQLVFGMFRMGFLLSILSPPIIKALTIGSAIYVTTSQMSDFFGITITKSGGYCQPIQDWIKIFSSLGNAHVPTVIISILTFSTLMIGKFVNEKYKSKLRVPIPTEIFVVTIAILSSYFGDFQRKFGVSVVENVPSGFPPPQVPDFTLMPAVIGDAFSVAIVGLAISVSLAKLYAQRYEYEVDLNQEMVAYGASGLIPSFFFCFPSAAALARCEILVSSGGKTQVCGFVASIVMLFTILFLGPVFEPLPKAILSCVIIVGLSGILAQLGTVPDLFRKSKIDFLVWAVTFLSILVFSISLGLLIGVVFSLLTVVARTQLPKCERLRAVPGAGDVYVNEKCDMQFDEDVGSILIFKFNSILYFANVDIFAKKLEAKIKKHATFSGSAKL